MTSSAYALASDAASMEFRLLKLREAMEEERRKRNELLMSKGSIWQSSQSGLSSSRRGAGISSSKSSTINQRRDNTSSSKTIGKQQQAVAELTTCHIHNSPGSNGAVVDMHFRPPATKSPNIQLEQRKTNAVNSNADASADVHGNGKAHANGIVEGNFDEDASHNSFLAALMEWRGGGGSAGPSLSAEPISGSQSRRTSGAAATEQNNFVNNSCNEVQTERLEMQRTPVEELFPTTTKRRLSYFDKLLSRRPPRESSHMGDISDHAVQNDEQDEQVELRGNEGGPAHSTPEKTAAALSAMTASLDAPLHNDARASEALSAKQSLIPMVIAPKPNYVRSENLPLAEVLSSQILR
eukprot:jgi/Chlat1/4299/Chrsp29S04387